MNYRIDVLIGMKRSAFVLSRLPFNFRNLNSDFNLPPPPTPPFVRIPLLRTDASLVTAGDCQVFKLEVGGAEIWLMYDESH